MSTNHRMTHIDTIRGVAVLGILTMNMLHFAFGGEGYYDLMKSGNATRVDWALSVLGEVFADQKFMGMFSLLFGASFSIFYERSDAKGLNATRLTLWRNTLLLVIGGFHAAIWEGDVLTIYALCVPLLLMVRRRSPSAQVLGGSALFLSALGSNAFFGSAASDDMIRDIWNGALSTEEHELMSLLILIDAYCRAAGLMMVGMGLYQSGFLKNTTQIESFRGHALFALVSGAIVSAIGVAWSALDAFSANAIILGGLANTVATIPMTLALVVLVAGWDTQSNGRLVIAIRSLGQTALSNYLGQTLLGLGLVALVGASHFTRTTMWASILTIWGFQLIGSYYWLRRFRFGPVEWLWRTLTHRRIESILRTTT